MPGGRANSLSTRVKRALLHVYASAYIGLKTYVRYPAWILSDVISTPIWIIMLLLPILLFLPREEWSDPTTYQYFYWGMVFWSVISMAMWSVGMAIRWEQNLGTIEWLFLSNANRVVLFASRVINRIVDLTISSLYMALLMYLMFNAPITVKNLSLLVAFMLLSMAVSLGIGAVYGAAILKLKEPGALSNVLQFVILGLSGIFFPIQRLPEFLRVVALLIPYTYCVDLVRFSAMGTPTLLPLHQEIALVVVLAVVLNYAGILALKIVERNMKRTGKLGAY